MSDSTLPYTLQRALDRFAFGLDLVLDAIQARVAAPVPGLPVDARTAPEHRH
ncbi:hypothetical protein [Plantactinospora sp. CA-290183]|uniref:hypothetical protein n=1 Tax=Plantactinospora sp. CA-290183 TaxID=3240006 RepID=UPI003D902C9C